MQHAVQDKRAPLYDLLPIYTAAHFSALNRNCLVSVLSSRTLDSFWYTLLEGVWCHSMLLSRCPNFGLVYDVQSCCCRNSYPVNKVFTNLNSSSNACQSAQKSQDMLVMGDFGHS